MKQQHPKSKAMATSLPPLKPMATPYHSQVLNDLLIDNSVRPTSVQLMADFKERLTFIEYVDLLNLIDDIIMISVRSAFTLRRNRFLNPNRFIDFIKALVFVNLRGSDG